MQRKIPTPVRTAILNRFADAGLPINTLANEYLTGEGFAAFNDVVDQVRAEHGDATADEMNRDIREICDREVLANLGSSALEPYRRQFMAQNIARWAFGAAPDAVFATALGYGFEWFWLHNEQSGAPWGTTGAIVDGVNDLFSKRGVPYRVTDEREVVWHGDEKTYETVTAPALAVLDDARLAGARSEYEDALTALRSGGQKDLEDAIEESAKAVESTMKVLIGESKLPLTGKETAKPLIGILTQANVIPAHTDQMLFAAARIRNAAGGHGTGAAPRHTPEDLAVACVAAAGVAITYLAGKLA